MYICRVKTTMIKWLVVVAYIMTCCGTRVFSLLLVYVFCFSWASRPPNLQILVLSTSHWPILLVSVVLNFPVRQVAGVSVKLFCLVGQGNAVLINLVSVCGTFNGQPEASHLISSIAIVSMTTNYGMSLSGFGGNV